MKPVHFTQYLRPDGRKRPCEVECTDSIAAMAEELQKAGYLLEVEVLTTSEVSMTIEHSDEERLDEEGSLAHEICANDPGVTNTANRLIETAFKKLKEESK